MLKNLRIEFKKADIVEQGEDFIVLKVRAGCPSLPAWLTVEHIGMADTQIKDARYLTVTDRGTIGVGNSLKNGS